MGSLWDRVDKKEARGCWLWTGYTARNGYGQIGIGGKLWYVHRLAWLLTYGKIPKGICVCHTCDVRNCCNPRHLFLGTQADNLADMRAKGRYVGWHAVKAPANRKLTEAQVRFIRRCKLTQDALAYRFGVAQTTISAVRRRETWGNV